MMAASKPAPRAAEEPEAPDPESNQQLCREPQERQVDSYKQLLGAVIEQAHSITTELARITAVTVCSNREVLPCMSLIRNRRVARSVDHVERDPVNLERRQRGLGVAAWQASPSVSE